MNIFDKLTKNPNLIVFFWGGGAGGVVSEFLDKLCGVLGDE